VGGTGGEGPTLQGRRFRTVSDAEDIVTVIQDGIGGMPSFWMGDIEARQVAEYVWSLARVASGPVPGDPARGRTVFEGKGSCTTCHIVDGKGRGLGPELTDVGARRAAAFLRQAIEAPGADLPAGQLSPHASFLMVRATRSDGTALEGMRVWEDAFVLQLRDADGGYHSLAKASLDGLDRRFGSSLMPDYAETLSDDEVTDLVAYLASLRGRS
jgi:putative heme-binding domain-containing protein